MILESTLQIVRASDPGVKLWMVRGDEELAEFKFMSRTAAPDWGFLPQTPSVFRFDRSPVPNNNDYRVDISPLDADIRRINNYNDQLVDNYLYNPGTGLFNHQGFPKQQYLTMSFNLLKEIAIVGNYLQFETVKPTDDVSQMARTTHPHVVHKWDIVTGIDRVTTRHLNTPKGDTFFFLVSNEGYGFISLEYVRRQT